MSARTRSVAAGLAREARRAKLHAAQLAAAQKFDPAVLAQIVAHARRRPRRWRPVWFGRPQPRRAQFAEKAPESSLARAVARLRKASHPNGG